MNKVHFCATVCADKGKIRPNNEDNFFLDGCYLSESDRNKHRMYSKEFSNGSRVFAVFDGMGGEECGEEASMIASRVLAGHSSDAFCDSASADAFCMSVIAKANVLICNKIKKSGLKRMGTTCVIACVYGNKAKIYNIGDSRAYLIKNGILKQVSVDDTVVMSMVQKGTITLEQAATHEDRHRITQHLGIAEEEFLIEPHISEEIILCEDDKILLCSDGLTDMVSDEALHNILNSYRSVKCAKMLISEALKNGGADNVTALVIGREKCSNVRIAVFVICCVLIFALLIAGVSKALTCHNEKELTDKEYIYWAEDVSEVFAGTENWFLVSCGENANPEHLRFYSSDPSVLEVDEYDGYYKAIKNGNAVITVICGNAELTKEVRVIE